MSGHFLVTVVCDGAGSAAYSDVGAWLAATTFVEIVELYLSNFPVDSVTKDIAGEWILKVASAISSHAGQCGHSSRDYACTLLATIVGSENAIFVQIGDGAIVISHGEDDGWSYVFWPQHGEYINTTNFVVSANAENLVEVEVAHRRIDEFAMFSDGIENLVLHQDTRAVHDGFFNTMIAPVRRSSTVGVNPTLSAELLQYLGSPKICERTDDDKTLVLASRRMPPDKSVLDV